MMSNTSTPGAVVTGTGSSTVLWAAVAVLGAATLAMGAMLLRSNAVPVSVATEPVPLAAQAPAAEVSVPVLQRKPAAGSAGASAHPPAATAQKPAPKDQNKPDPKPQQVPTEAAPTAVVTTEPVAKPVERILPAPVCTVCGTVEAVTAVQREPESGSGVGVIAGAAIGGLLGNQVGGGTGKDLATIAGMVGGGWAGNTVEKKMKRETFYQVAVRMEDGSLRKLEQKAAVAVGTKVTVNGSTLTAATAAQ